MNLNEFNSFSLHDAVHFHDELNPELFNGDNLKPEVRDQLLLIAHDFVDHLGINDIEVQSIIEKLRSRIRTLQQVSYDRVI